jgi:hypothetical protein
MDMQVGPLARLVVDDKKRYRAAVIAAFEADGPALIGTRFLVAKNTEHHVPPACAAC